MLETSQCHPNFEISTSSFVANYTTDFHIISIERLVSVRLGLFMERCGVFPTTQFAYLKGLGTCDVFLCVSHTLQSAVENRK